MHNIECDAKYLGLEDIWERDTDKAGWKGMVVTTLGSGCWARSGHWVSEIIVTPTEIKSEKSFGGGEKKMK